MMKGFRDIPPSTYSLKMESFNTLLESTTFERYESRPFSPAGYNYYWTLVVYPNGNKKDGGTDHLSLYVKIDNSTLAEEVVVDLRFYIFNKKLKKYLTIQDTNVWRFNVLKTMWGFSKALPLNVFKDQSQGYLYDGDHCEFGVDITLPCLFQKYELFSITKNFPSPVFNWTLQRFSTLLQNIYTSDVFSIGGRNWKLQVYPNGRASGTGKALSMYLYLDKSEIFRPYEKIYVRAKLRVLNQCQLSNIEKQVDTCYGVGLSFGNHEFISLSDLKDSSKGFVVNDVLIVEAEIEALSSTKYLP